MISESAFVAQGAKVVGAVDVGENTSIWYNAVIRGDRSRIIIGNYTNIQDLVLIHSPESFPVRVGDYSSVGHGAKVHGAQIGDNSLIGMSAILMNGVKVGDNCLVAAASVVVEATVVPDGSLFAGSPARMIRKLSNEEIESIRQNAIEYVSLSKNVR